LKCQFGISGSSHGGRRRLIPYVFTEQGIAMLSSVLRSKRAVQVTPLSPSMNPLFVHSPVMDSGEFRHSPPACLHYMAAAQ
jgi:hypothetical protein